MKHLSILILIILSFYSTQSMSQVTDSLSYSLGVLIGQNLQSQGFTDVNSDELAVAIRDLYAGNKQIDIAKATSIVQAASQKAAEAKFGDAKKAGVDFLAENAQKEGITTLPSGMQYEVLSQGDGAKPTATSQVTTHYHGMLIDGSVFDSSVERGEPATFPVNGVIQGWQEILPMMHTGSKYRVYIPSELAYGERGAGNDIPPFSALIFEIELISIQ